MQAARATKGIPLPIEGGLLTIACEKIARLDVPAFIKDSELRFVAVNPAFIAFLERISKTFSDAGQGN